MKYVLFTILLLLVRNLYAQDSTLIFIAAGKNISDVLTPDKIYRFSKFTNGKVFFRDGTISYAKLNYNYFNEEIEFIDPNTGNTLAIADEQIPIIKEVLIDTSSFFFNDGCLEQVMEHSALGKLLRKQMLVVVNTEKIGAYDMASSTTAIQTYGGVIGIDRSPGGPTSKLKARENMTLGLRTEYFFSDKYNLFLSANKKNLLKLFPSKKEKINSYLKEHSVDFRNENDLKKLFAFL